MLGKLMKHEFLASYRTYLPVYASLYVLSLLIFVSYEVSADAVAGLLIFVFSLLIGAMSIFTIFNLVTSLGTRVYGKPGYLLFSVPAKTRDIMLSKVIMNYLWVLASVFVSVTSVLIAFSVLGIYDDMIEFFSFIWQDLNINTADVIGMILYFAMYILYLIAFFMFLFALLNLIYKGERKILVGLLLYLVLSMILNYIINNVSSTVTDMFLGSSGNGSVWYVVIIYALISVVLFSFSYYFLNKKMELK